MSFLLMARAMKSDIPDCYAKWLMVALCDHANEDPSMLAESRFTCKTYCNESNYSYVNLTGSS